MALLDAGEEKRLGAEIAAGSIQARNRLMMANTRLVVSIAKKYRTQGLDFLDIIQSGNVGLIGAAGRFDVRKGCRFSTYGKWQVQRRIHRARRAEMKHTARRDDDDVLKTIPDTRAGMPEDAVFGEIDCERVRRLLDGIGQRAAAVLRLAYGIGGEGPLARAEIAGRLGVTPERVRQVRNRALRRMRMMLSEDG